MIRLQLCLLILFSLAPMGLAQSASIDNLRDRLVSDNVTTAADVHTPAEFEPQDAVWLAWPAYDYEADLPMANLTAQIIRVLKPHVPVKLLVPDAEWLSIAQMTLDELAVPTDHVTFVTIPYDEPWLRDMGPVFVIADGNTKEMVDFNFSGWGNYAPEDPYPRIEEPVDRLIAEWLGIENNMTRLIGEGGNREFNGQGVMMSVAPTELQRNPNLTLEEIETEFKRLFGVSKVIWLPHNLYDDSLAPTIYPGPNGEKAYGYGVAHIDELARFVGPNTILLAEVTEEEALSDTFALVNRQRLEENYEMLRQATDQNGEPFEIIRIPAAMTEYMQVTEEDYIYVASSDITHEDGIKGHDGPIWWVPAKSYANFLITNGAVLVAQYWRPGRPLLEQEKDAEAMQVLQTVFPDREIIPFAPELALAVNVGAGGIHCITAQEPSISIPNSVDTRLPALPDEFSLQQNYPNPFNPTTLVRFELPEAAAVELIIYNANGRLVRTLVNENRLAGSYEIEWNAQDDSGWQVASGIYIYRLTAGEFSQAKKLTLMR